MIWLSLSLVLALLVAGGALIFADKMWRLSRVAQRQADEARDDFVIERDARAAYERLVAGLQESLRDAERRARHRESKASRQSRAALPLPENPQ